MTPAKNMTSSRISKLDDLLIGIREFGVDEITSRFSLLVIVVVLRSNVVEQIIAWNMPARFERRLENAEKVSFEISSS